MSYFQETQVDKIIVIGLARRTDRRERFDAEMKKLGIKSHVWFDGYDRPSLGGNPPSGNAGCTASHRGVLELIAFNKWERALVFEDDTIIRPDFSPETAANQLFVGLSEVPRNAEIIYLGGSYANNPKRRISKHVIEVSRMMTTSSYIINWTMAKKMAPHIYGGAPIDVLFSGFTEHGNSYCIHPRVFVQGPSMSDLTDSMAENITSMLDERHEDMLLHGNVSERNGELVLHGTLQRRELARATDADGEEVIAEGVLYKIKRLELPPHKPSWFRGEPVTYVLQKT